MEIENPKCCGSKMFRSYAKEKIGNMLYMDIVYLCKKCKLELFVTIRQIETDCKTEVKVACD